MSVTLYAGVGYGVSLLKFHVGDDVIWIEAAATNGYSGIGTLHRRITDLQAKEMLVKACKQDPSYDVTGELLA